MKTGDSFGGHLLCPLLPEWPVDAVASWARLPLQITSSSKMILTRSVRDGLLGTWYLLGDMPTCMVERPLRN